MKPFCCAVNDTFSLNLVVEPPQVAELEVWPVAALSKLALPSLTNEPCGEEASPRYSTSSQTSSSFGTAPPPQMPSTVAVTADPVTSFQIAIGGHWNGTE